MTPATAISLASTLLCLAAAGVMYRLSTAPGWRPQRWYALAALSGAAFVACDVVFTMSVSTPVTVWAARLQLLPAAVNVVAWNIYARQFVRQPSDRLDRILAVTLLLGGVLGLIPGVAYSDDVRQTTFHLLNLSYRYCEPTLGGLVILGLDCSGLIFVVVRFTRAWQAGVPYARQYSIGVLTVLLAGVHDTLVTAGVIEGPLLIDLSCVVPLAGLVLSQTSRFVQATVMLEQLSASLEQQVEQRTRALGEAQQTLARAEKLAAVGTLAAGVAHEINNPAAALSANLEFLRDERLVMPDGQGALRDSMEAVDRITRIVRQLLASSRAAADPGTPSTRAVRVSDAVRRSLRTLVAARPAAPPVKVEVPEDLFVTGQELPLIQILTNLITNAFDALRSGRAPLVTVAALSRGQRVEIVVEDNGVGMTSDTTRRLFEPFFTTKPVGEGTGLGLSVSRGLVRSMSGDIRVESTFQQGTRLVIELPRAEAPIDSEDPTCPGVIPAASLRVLVVESNPQVRVALARQLGGRFQTEVVAGADEARHRLRAGAPIDLVLCDADASASEGDGQGAQLYRQVASDNRDMAARFVFMTGEALTAAAQSFLETQPQPVVRKPVELSALLAAANRVAARVTAAPLAARG